MFGRGGPRPGSGRLKKIKTPIKKKYKAAEKILIRRQQRAQYFSVQKQLLECIKSGDSRSERYNALVADYNRLAVCLGLAKSTTNAADDLHPHGSSLDISSDEVKIHCSNKLKLLYQCL